MIMASEINYIKIANGTFAKTDYDATNEDITRLADNMALLDRRGLGDLNKRLNDAGRGIWATIAEHNFAVKLVSQHCSTVPIIYEPDMGAGRGRPDFKVVIGDITYWIQMKDLSKLERENRQEKIIEKVKKAAREIKVGKFFVCLLSDDFQEDCIPELINFMKEKAESAIDSATFLYVSNNNHRAEVTFWTDNKSNLSELTLGCSGDLNMVDITGQDNDHIKGSLCKAAGAFTWEVDHRNINLIVMEADNKRDINICEALFGTEYENIGRHSWGRNGDGFFGDSQFATKVAGVIAVKRKAECEELRLSPEDERVAENWAREVNMTPEQLIENAERRGAILPISGYTTAYFVNREFVHLLEDVKRLLPLDHVFHNNMRP